MLLRVTDLKQWAYCKRIVYYQYVMPGAGKPTYKMREGAAAQEVLERLEMRRTLREYGLEGARRHFGLWMNDEGLGLTGKVDLLLEGAGVGSVVEFKLTSGEVTENHKLQLAGYAVLAEAVRTIRVGVSFIYRIPDNKIFPVTITEELRHTVSEAMRGIREVRMGGSIPDATAVRRRCHECEYANYCGDVW